MVTECGPAVLLSIINLPQRRSHTIRLSYNIVKVLMPKRYSSVISGKSIESINSQSLVKPHFKRERARDQNIGKKI